jgi:hypothetical protein
MSGHSGLIVSDIQPCSLDGGMQGKGPR